MIVWVLEGRRVCCVLPCCCAERDGCIKCHCVPVSRLSSLPGKAFSQIVFLLASGFGFLWTYLVCVLNFH